LFFHSKIALTVQQSRRAREGQNIDCSNFLPPPTKRQFSNVVFLEAAGEVDVALV